MKGRLTLWAVAAGLTVAVVGLSLRFMDPFPPNRIVLATGQPGGAYDGFGREYQSRLAREGLRVELRRTAGSVENLERLLRGEVDVAFVQGGTYPLVKDIRRDASPRATAWTSRCTTRLIPTCRAGSRSSRACCRTGRSGG